MIVDDRRHGPRFPGEPLSRRAVRRILSRQYLDRHRAVQRRVERLQHDTHTPLPHDFEHFVIPEPAQR